MDNQNAADTDYVCVGSLPKLEAAPSWRLLEWLRQRVLGWTGKSLAGEAATAHVPRVVSRADGGDPRFWALVAMHTPPPRLNFVASDLRLSKNLNWRSRQRSA